MFVLDEGVWLLRDYMCSLLVNDDFLGRHSLLILYAQLWLLGIQRLSRLLEKGKVRRLGHDCADAPAACHEDLDNPIDCDHEIEPVDGCYSEQDGVLASQQVREDFVENFDQ